MPRPMRLLWRVADGEDKLANEKQYNADRQKEWESACERSNRELKAARDEVIRLKGEKTKLSDEHEHAVAMYHKRENEYTQCIAMLENIAAEKTAESKASEILAEKLVLIASGYLRSAFPWYIADRIVKSDELVNYMFELGGDVYNSGRKDGYGEGRAAAATNEKEYHFDLYKEDCTAAYAAKRREYEFLEFAIVKVVGKLSRKADAMETLKKALGEQDAEIGPSDQVSRMNDGYDRLLLLCFDDPAVHLVLPSLGGLQCLFYHVYDVFVYRLVRSNSRLTGFDCVYLTRLCT
ncbi:hypothetical protein Hanom_Chr15g01367901 [Helianthus anomalus]